MKLEPSCKSAKQRVIVVSLALCDLSEQRGRQIDREVEVRQTERAHIILLKLNTSLHSLSSRNEAFCPLKLSALGSNEHPLRPLPKGFAHERGAMVARVGGGSEYWCYSFMLQVCEAGLFRGYFMAISPLKVKC